VTNHAPLSRPDLALLVFIILFGASLRLLWIESPLLDNHRWRQVDTAGIARSFYEDRFNIFYPQVNWGGHDGYVESEFPLVPALTAVLYNVVGEERPFLGRVVVMVFSTATIWLVFGLGAELLGAGGGLAAAFLMAVSPTAVYFGRTFMPDSVMLFFWVGGVWAFLRYLRSGSRRALWLGSGATALACLVKIPALMMFAPIAGAAWYVNGRAALRDRALIMAVVAPLVLTAAWYMHAFFLFERTGLTFGILAHPARTYPPDIAPGPWPYAFSKWSNIPMLTGSDYYLTLLYRLYQLLLLPWGFVGALLGAVVWKRRDGRLVADVWVAAFLVFVLVMGFANISHEYYQLPIIPVGALYLAALTAPAFASGVEGRAAWAHAAGLAVLLTFIGGTSIYYSGVINSHFRPNNLDMRVAQAGESLGQIGPPKALMIVADDYGAASPLLLYYAHRKGWSFDVENLSPAVVEGLKRKGAMFFATTVWSRIERERPETAAHLESYRLVDLQNAPRDTVMFDLTRWRE